VRIGFFTCNAPPLLNGLAISIRQSTRHLRRLGHRVFIFAPRYPGHRQEEPDVFRFPSLRVPTHHRYALPLPAAAPALPAVIAGLGLEIVHAHHPFLVGPYAHRLARRLGLPFVFTYHTLYEHYGHYVPVLSRLAARVAEARSYAFAGRADLVVAPTVGVRRRLLDHGVTVPVEVVPTGVELPPPPEEPRPVLRRRLGLAGAGPLLLYVGRLAKEKNLELLLRAVGSTVEVAPGVVLVLVGEGDMDRPLRRLAEAIGVAHRVRFIGPVPHEQVGRWYRAADLFVFPSVSETQGLVVLEAMAHGLPVLACRSIGTSDFIEDGVSGALAEPSEAGFTARLLALLRDEDAMAGYARQGIAVASRYSAAASAERLIALYERLTTRSRFVAAGGNPARRP
jgi:1,2-diacylglycerol 3-alpha-glucosyltransferase